MKGMYRFLGFVVSLFFIVLFGTGTFFFIRKVWFGSAGSVSSSYAPVVVVDIQGLMYTSTATVKKLEKLRKNPHVKAIVIRINSPGGLVAPSQEIYEAIRDTDKVKPVIISMGALAASGGYYAALGGRKIFANAGTLTGSIGVLIEFMNTEKLLQWAKVERFALKAGKFKTMGSPYRNMEPEERALFQELLNNIYEQFRQAVAQSRKLSLEELNRVADGRILTGQQAKASKLVDELGSLERAIAEAKKIAKLPEDAEISMPQSNPGLLKKLILEEEEEASEEASSTAVTSASTSSQVLKSLLLHLAEDFLFSTSQDKKILSSQQGIEKWQMQSGYRVLLQAPLAEVY